MTTDSPSACAPSLFVGAVGLARSDACQQIRLVGDRTGWLGQQGSNFCIRIVPPWAYRYRVSGHRDGDPARFCCSRAALPEQALCKSVSEARTGFLAFDVLAVGAT